MKSKNVLYDLKAGIVVFLVALPLCLGIALACKVPLFSGIIAGVVGGIIVTIFSGSKYSVSGPAAGLTAIVLASISQLGSFQVFLAAVVFAGVMQLILGILKAGSIGNYIPNAVIKGMLAGIGIILILKQIPHLFGYDKDPEGDEQFIQLADGENSFTELVNMINFITPGAIIIGLLSFAILILSERPFYKKNKILSFLPGPLLAVVTGILLTVAFKSNPFLAIDAQHLVKLPSISNFSDLKANLIFPDFSFVNTSGFWMVVVTLAVVASLETLLGIEAIDKLDADGNLSNTNKELLAQGIGNIACGFLGGLPVTSVIVRSSANINSGAKTKLSVIIHAVLLLVSVLLLPNLLAMIPNACLAAILIMTGLKLTKYAIFKEQWKFGLEQFIPFVITIVVMLVTDLLKGVCAGLVVAIFYIIRDNIKLSFDMVINIVDGKINHQLTLPQHLTFFNKGYLIDYFSNIKAGSTVIIDGSINQKINRDAKDVIDSFIDSAEKHEIKVELINYKN
jgi:MFS superfamily sulfate permease-like transporter